MDTNLALNSKTIRPGTQLKRVFSVDARSAINVESRTVELAFSSETPYERYWGVEILDHKKSSIRLGRLKSGGPVLLDHENTVRNIVGAIESVAIDTDRVGRAVVRFGKDAASDEIFQKVQDGIVRNISVGYIIHEAVLEKTGSDTADTFRVTDWEPLEISFVAVPADATVGVGRALSNGSTEPNPIVDAAALAAESASAAQTNTPSDTASDSTPANEPAPAAERVASKKETRMSDINVEEMRAVAHTAGAKEANDRVKAILDMGAQYKCSDLAEKCLREGASVEQFRDELLRTMANKPIGTAAIGMTEKETRQFSFIRAINALANPLDKKAQDAAGFEREVSDAVATKMGRSAQGFFVPHDVQTRDLVVGTPTAGGNLVATDLLSGSFIEMFRNRMAVVRAGAQTLSGLTGQIAIPRQTGGATAYWVGESGAPAESQAAFDQVTMTPRTLGAFSDISRKMLLQSSIDVEQFVRADLAKQLAIEGDRVALFGSGTAPEPRGVANTSGIGSVAGGTNGLALTWANAVKCWSAVSAANADFGTTGFVTNSKVIGSAMTIEKATNTAQFICPGFPDANGIASIGGARTIVSNQVPSNLTKGTSSGVCSALLFGNWSELIIGLWGTLDLMVDPYTQSTSGTVRVIALQDTDIAVRHAASFAAILDVLTP